jgi:putative ABC transport system ATP-binding protein
MSPLVVKNITKTYRQGDRLVEALRGISIDVAQGQFLAIMGASGSGKSTLLHLMAGLTTAQSGQVLVNNTDLGSMSDKTLTLFRRKHIGLVFQAFNLIPTLSAEENIALPAMLGGRLSQAQKMKIEALMETLGIASRRRHRPDALSGGEQQRVAIGRALVSDPAIILADEPTGNLDSANSRSVCELLRDLSVVHNKTIVMVTHEPTVATFAREVAVLRDGNLVNRFSTDGMVNGHDVAMKYQESIR